MEVFQQQVAPVADSLVGSALVGLVPLLVVFVALGGLRMRAHFAGLLALGTAVLVAVLAFGMPWSQAVSAGAQGALFGLIPILWILVNAIWVHDLTVRAGSFDVLRRLMGRISDDRRVQTVVIAFCFGGLLEALAGFGAPVAITVVMVVGLGYPPLKAAAAVLVANTAPVAFGAMAVPIVTAGRVAAPTPADAEALADVVAAITGRQTPVLALVVPLILVAMLDGRRGVRETWVPAVSCGAAFAVAQFAVSNYFVWELTDIVAALAGIGAVLAHSAVVRARRVAVPATGGVVTAESRPSDPRRDSWRAVAPYLIIIAVFGVAKIPAVDRLLARLTITTDGWPGLAIAAPGCDPAAPKCLLVNDFSINPVATAGSLLLLSGLITAVLLKVRAGEVLRAYGETVVKLRHTIVTVMSVLALAFVMNKAGMTGTIGVWMASAGGVFALLSPVLGWLGVAVTGSDTSSNALFAKLQASAGTQAGIDPALLVSANTSGGVVGKMVSPQSLAVATAATGTTGQEGELFRRVIGYSIALLAVMAVLVYLQSTPVLSWMLP